MSNSSSKEYLLKNIYINRDSFESLNEIAILEDTNIDELISQALDEWIEAKTKALLQEQFESQRRETNFDYDEFWEGVDLD